MNAMGKVRAALGAALLVAVVGAQAAIVTTRGTWYGTDGTNGTLRGRDASGNPVPLLVSGAPNPAAVFFYDTVLNLTWLADWNANGLMNWAAANAWAAALNVGGFTGWSLPGVLDTASPGCDVGYAGGTDCGFNVYSGELERRGSPLAHMFYDTLGNLAYCPPQRYNVRWRAATGLGADQHRAVQQHAVQRLLVRYGVRAVAVGRRVALRYQRRRPGLRRPERPVLRRCRSPRRCAA